RRPVGAALWGRGWGAWGGPVHLQAELAVVVVVLQGGGDRLAAGPLDDAGRGRQRGGDRREARDAAGRRGAADVGAVGSGTATARRVHHEVDLARGQQLDRVETFPLVLAQLADD